MNQLGPLYHWSPRDRLKRIKKQGLRPGQLNICGPVFHAEGMDPDDPRYADVVAAGEFRQDSLCFSLDPATAWAYSHAAWGSVGTFDLWQVQLVDSDEVHVLPMWGAGVAEVRVRNPIDRHRLRYIGERCVPTPAEVAATGSVPRSYPSGPAREARALIRAVRA